MSNLISRRPRETALVWAASAGAGAAAGAVSALFLLLYEAARFWPAPAEGARLCGLTLTRPLLAAAPALGGLLCGLVVERVEPAARGTGTPELLHAVRGRGARIGARYAAWKTLASVFTVCSGGSAGPEAPMVTAGAGAASWTAARLRLPPRAVRILTAAGAAAGFAAVFDAPAAGAVFALEVLLREADLDGAVAVVVASAAGTAAARGLLGPRAFLSGVAGGAAPDGPGGLLRCGALAVLAALFAKLFIETAIHVEKAFEKAFTRPSARAAAGGLALGLLGLVLPQALGNSHPDVPALFAARAAAPIGLGALAFLLFGKLLACPLTVGSGGSGGIFIPYLMMGACLGAAFGGAPYMVAGMGAVFAAVTLAPLTAFVLVLELTRAWGLALPLGVAVAVAFALARAIEPESLDTRKLLKRGVRLREQRPSDWELDSPEHAAGS